MRYFRDQTHLVGHWHRRRGFRQIRQLQIAKQLDPALFVLDQGGAILHPVAAVGVGGVSDLSNGRTVDMTAEHALHGEALGRANNSRLVSAIKLTAPLTRCLTALLNDQ